MLTGKKINLRLLERKDLPEYVRWFNDPSISGPFNPLVQTTVAQYEKSMDSNKVDKGTFIIETQTGEIAGMISYFNLYSPTKPLWEIGYIIDKLFRKKGYCTEAIQILVDFLFLTKPIPRIQAHSHVKNIGSRKILEKVGFSLEGVVRKMMFVNGEWSDFNCFSILREEWGTPSILDLNSFT